MMDFKRTQLLIKPLMQEIYVTVHAEFAIANGYRISLSERNSLFFKNTCLASLYYATVI